MSSIRNAFVRRSVLTSRTVASDLASQPQLYVDQSLTDLVLQATPQQQIAAQELIDEFHRFLTIYSRAVQWPDEVEGSERDRDITYDAQVHRVHISSPEADRLWRWFSSHNEFIECWRPFGEKNSKAELRGGIDEIQSELLDGRKLAFLYCAIPGVSRALRSSMDRTRKPPTSGIVNKARDLIGQINIAIANEEVSEYQYMGLRSWLLAIDQYATESLRPKRHKPRSTERRIVDESGQAMLVLFKFNTPSKRPFPVSLRHLLRFCGKKPPEDDKTIRRWLRELAKTKGVD
jgi:hypothetical protein